MLRTIACRRFILASGEGTDYERIHRLVAGNFDVGDYYMREEGKMEFLVQIPGQFKERFLSLYSGLRAMGYLAIARRERDSANLLVLKRPPPKKRSHRIPLILFLATIVTVTIDGWSRSIGFNRDLTFQTALYAVAIMGIIGIHELGHKLASSLHGVRSSVPYFIPGIPSAPGMPLLGLPTFGAVIVSDEPATNRDTLFDIGIAGPLAGLLVTFLVAVPGALTSTTVPASEVELAGSLPPNLALVAILTAANAVKPDMATVLSPLGFAAWLGFLVTFLNILPASQLDGGHMARAALGRRWHRVATMTSVVFLLLSGYYFMGLLVLAMSMASIEMRPLDDISPLSRSRKIVFVLTLILGVTIAPAPTFLF